MPSKKLEAIDRALLDAIKARKAAEKEARLLEAHLARRGRMLGPLAGHDARRSYTCFDGIGIIFSDAHFWPGEPSTAFRALLKVAEAEKPNFVVANGDIIDGARISRWPVSSFDDYEGRPTVTQELAVAQERMRAIVAATPEADHFWTLGNHDARFETYIGEHAPEAIGVPGTRLKDHFPDWRPAWSVMVNADTDPIMIKHRYRSGMYAPRNNVMNAQTHMITGHLHSQKIMEQTGYKQTLYGVDAGSILAPYSPQVIHYTEDNPVDWRSGFVVIKIAGGTLRRPQLVTVIDEAHGIVEYLGEDISV